MASSNIARNAGIANRNKQEEATARMAQLRAEYQQAQDNHPQLNFTVLWVTFQGRKDDVRYMLLDHTEELMARNEGYALQKAHTLYSNNHSTHILLKSGEKKWIWNVAEELEILDYSITLLKSR